MELSELQKRVDAWIREYGVRYFSELTNMAILTEEEGELARVMARKPTSPRKRPATRSGTATIPSYEPKPRKAGIITYPRRGFGRG